MAYYLKTVVCRPVFPPCLSPTMSSFRSIALLSLAALALATPLSTSPDGAVRRSSRYNPYPIAPLHQAPPHRVINDSYIVMFKDGVHPAAFASHFNFLEEAHGSSPLDRAEAGLTHVWDAHIKGYAGYFSRDVVERIRQQPEVDYVEHDQIVHALETQKSAPWVNSISLSLSMMERVDAIHSGACANQPSGQVELQHFHSLRV